ncbi:MAG: hypothetical protein ACREPA_11200 [Candidatus Dormibacteraceae bacterium]
MRWALRTAVVAAGVLMVAACGGTPITHPGSVHVEGAAYQTHPRSSPAPAPKPSGVPATSTVGTGAGASTAPPPLAPPPPPVRNISPVTSTSSARPAGGCSASGGAGKARPMCPPA